jgi:hypothetical protein
MISLSRTAATISEKSRQRVHAAGDQFFPKDIFIRFFFIGYIHNSKIFIIYNLQYLLVVFFILVKSVETSITKSKPI